MYKNKNMEAFHNLTDRLGIQYEDVLIRMFKHSLEGECNKWFQNFPQCSISPWGDFHDLFMNTWAKRKSYH